MAASAIAPPSTHRATTSESESAPEVRRRRRSCEEGSTARLGSEPQPYSTQGPTGAGLRVPKARAGFLLRQTRPVYWRSTRQKLRRRGPVLARRGGRIVDSAGRDPGSSSRGYWQPTVPKTACERSPKPPPT